MSRRKQNSGSGSSYYCSDLEDPSKIDQELRQEIHNFELGDWRLPYDELKFDESKKLGEGAYGVVYEATYKNTSKVAVKHLKDGYKFDTLKTFVREVSIMKLVNGHHSIIKFIGATDEPELCIVTELMPCGSLYDLIHVKNVQIPVDIAIRIARDVCEAMVYINKLGVLHRDISTENLLLNEKGEIKLCDFGVARKEKGKGPQPMSPTGNPRWRAPEVTRHEFYSKKADVYSFGIVLWELLTLRKPFELLTGKEAALYTASGYKLEIPQTCPRGLGKLIGKCWEENPKKRPSFKKISKILDREAHRAQNSHSHKWEDKKPPGSSPQGSAGC